MIPETEGDINIRALPVGPYQLIVFFAAAMADAVAAALTTICR
jgi:hypothetical protein